jgi:hypothetical protein
MSSQTARALADRVAVVPEFSNSVQRLIEAIVEREKGEVKRVHLRPTHSHFDDQGKTDFRPAVEAWALFIEGTLPKHLNEKVVDISSTLKARQLERGTEWRISASVRRVIMTDIAGTAKLPTFRISK